jgi:chromosome partitioning protein
MAKIIAIANQKGGVGKTTLALNLGSALTRLKKKICLIDCDPQANLTMALGYQQPDELPFALPHLMQELINNGSKTEKCGLLHKREYILKAQGLDFIPSSIDLISIESALYSAISRESILKKIVAYIKDGYDYVIIDTMPSLNFTTINALNASDSIIIPMQPQFFSAKGLELLLSTIANVKETLNSSLEITGVVITMYDTRLKFHREVINSVRETYGEDLKIFETKIPASIRITEMQARAQSVYDADPKSKISESYENFAKEMLIYESERQ